MMYGSRQSKEHSWPLIPSLDGTTSSCMVTSVVPATTPPMLKLGIRECNVLKQNNVNDSFLLNIPLFFVAFFAYLPMIAQGRSYILFWGLAVVIGLYSSG